MRHTATRFCVVIKLGDRENFTGSTMPLALTKIFVTHMRTRDLLPAANVLVVFVSNNYVGKRWCCVDNWPWCWTALHCACNHQLPNTVWHIVSFIYYQSFGCYNPSLLMSHFQVYCHL